MGCVKTPQLKVVVAQLIPGKFVRIQFSKLWFYSIWRFLPAFYDIFTFPVNFYLFCHLTQVKVTVGPLISARMSNICYVLFHLWQFSNDSLIRSQCFANMCGTPNFCLALICTWQLMIIASPIEYFDGQSIQRIVATPRHAGL